MRRRTGTIDTTRDRRYRLRISRPGHGRVTVGVYATREEADVERRALATVAETECDDGVTFRQYSEAWLMDRDVRHAVADPETDWSRWRNHIADDHIARVKVSSLRRAHVRKWLHRVLAKVAVQTAKNALNIVRGCLAQALDDGLVKENVALGIKVPKEKRTQDEWTFASEPEQRALVAATQGPERWVLAFAMGTGLRAGELVTLRLADVHVDGDSPRVVVRYGSVPDLPTKGGRIRTVPLFGLGLMAAREWLAAMPGWLRGTNPRGLMFPRVRGGFRDEDHVLRWSVWKGILEAAGITRTFRWHDLRHTCASSLVSGLWGRRWSLLEVRDLLGHASVTTTERYAHMAGSALTTAAEEARAIGLNWPHGMAAHKPQLREITGAPPRGLEPLTNGLGSPRNLSRIVGGIDSRGQLVAVSIAYLRAVASGDAAGEVALAAQLGALLMSDRTRAIEMAEAIVAAAELTPKTSTK